MQGHDSIKIGLRQEFLANVPMWSIGQYVERRKSADIAGSLLLAESASESLTLVCHPVASKPAVAADQNCKEITMARKELIAPALLLVIAGATAQAADMLADFRNSLLQVIRPDIQ